MTTLGGFCANIAGQTTSSYTLTSADVGNTVRLAVTGTNTTGSDISTSVASAAVAAAAGGGGGEAVAAAAVVVVGGRRTCM